MKKTLKKITASIMAVATFAVGITGMSANAYVSKDSWDILIVSNAPQLPNQHRTCTRTIPTFGKGYISYCSSISGSNNRSVSVSAIATEGISYSITTTGYSSVHKATVSGGNITFTFRGVGTDITANGTIGYNL